MSRFKWLTVGSVTVRGVDGTGFVKLEVELENALQQIEELKHKNKGLEEQLWGAVAGGDVVRQDMGGVNTMAQSA
jgi:hypothetical protein